MGGCFVWLGWLGFVCRLHKLRSFCHKQNKNVLLYFSLNWMCKNMYIWGGEITQLVKAQGW